MRARQKRQRQKRPRVVVVGAGFGGMQTAQSLAKSGAEVLLIDRNNYNTFVPLLYQVATAQIEPEMIAYPLRTVLRRAKRTRFLQANVERVDFDNQVVEADGARVSYDYLVMATGSRTQYLGVSGATESAFALRTLEQAIALRNHILRCFELAEKETKPMRRRQLLTFTVVGGGPTGIEMAGALFEMKNALRKDYPMLDMEEVRIILVQSGDRLLRNLPSKLGYHAARKLSRLGVNVLFQTRVNRVSPQAVEFQDGACLPTATVVWAAGLEGALPDTSVAPSAAAKQKVKVRPTLQLLEAENVYAIGDLAYVQQNGKPLTGVAPEALQQGVAVARNIARQIKGKGPQPFRYLNKGRLAIVGGYGGVGKIGPVLLTGFLPWLMWLSVHLVYLPGFRSRLLVLLSWLHGYGLGDRAVRQVFASSPVASRALSEQPISEKPSEEQTLTNIVHLH